MGNSETEDRATAVRESVQTLEFIQDIPVSKRVRMDLMWNTDKEYMAGLRYIIKRNFRIRTHHDSDVGLGFGANLNY